MAKPHKHARASASIVTELQPAEIASLCEIAAKRAETLQALVRLEESKPERLVYSVRNRLVGGLVEFMTFEVRLTDGGDHRTVTTRIQTYKQKRSWILFFPLPWQMVAWANYKRFMYTLAEGIQSTDIRSKSHVAELLVRV